MQRLKDAVTENQKAIKYSLLASTLMLGTYGLFRYRRGSIKAAIDPHFQEQNLPLYATEAFKRDKILKEVSYKLTISLSKTETFEGQLTTLFRINDGLNQQDLSDLFLDFHGNSVYDYQVNGIDYKPYQINFNKHKLHIPFQHLKINDVNQVKLKFTNTFVNNSAGFSRYQDPINQEIYMYTHLEPFNCHRWFPCFDQPSVRARLNLSVISPDHTWSVVANEKEKLKKRLNELDKGYLDPDTAILAASHDPNQAQLHVFEETPPISSYIYGLFAGNFHVFENMDPKEKIPMKIYLRKTKAEQMNAEELFRVISIGIKYYEKFFGTAFPFSKYDHIFCPEFRIGAMENVGAIAFNDGIYIKPKNEQTDTLHHRLAYVALHELAHMWFGDLVTMKWWTDLWLKESFADFMSVTCLCEDSELKNYKNPELRVVAFTHQGLEDDVKPTTHSIRVEVKHTIDAVNIFDQICYQKGASFLKQMSHFVTREVMMKGSQEYFQKYAYQTTSLEDYINCVNRAYISAGGKVNLIQWTDSWLTKSGPNTLIPIVEQDGEKFKISIKQEFPKFGDQVYRQQVLDVALFNENMTPTYIENVMVNNTQTTPSIYVGDIKDLPRVVFINANNKGYCRILLDQQSLQHIVQNLHKIQNTPNRCYLWRSLQDQIKLKALKPAQFLECVKLNLPYEDEEQIVPFILYTATELIKFYIGSVDSKTKYSNELYHSIWQKLAKTKEPNLQKSLITDLLNLLPNSELTKALEWLKNNTLVIENLTLPLNKSYRYQIIKAVYRSKDYSLEQKEVLVQEERARETTEIDNYQKEAVLACLPDQASKEKMYQEFIEGKKYNVAFLKYTTSEFHNEFDIEVSRYFRQKFFNDIEKMFQKQHRDYAEVFFMNLKPTFMASQEDLVKWEEILKRAEKTDNTHFINLIKVEIDHIKEILEIKE